MSVESIWENFKSTPSFFRGIIDACKEMDLSPGDVEVIRVSWADTPVDVEVNYLDDSDTLQIYPTFFGETLTEFTPITVREYSGIKAPATIHADKVKIYQECLTAFENNPGMDIQSSSGLDYSDPNDFIAVFSATFEDDDVGAGFTKISFHVKFDENFKLTESYALECKHGNEIWVLPLKPSPKI